MPTLADALAAGCDCTSNRTPNRARALVAVITTVTFIVVVFNLVHRSQGGTLSDVKVSPELQWWSVRTSVYVGFVQILSQVIDPGLQFGKQRSVLADAGGSDWKVTKTYILPKKFFGGNSEGVAHLPQSNSLIFTGKNIIRRTEPTFPFATELVSEHAIPANFTAAGGYNHIGDISTMIYNGKEVILTSLEEPTYTKPLMMMFDANTLQYELSCPLHQSHSSLLAVDAAANVMYSSEFTDVGELKRYAFPSCEELTPLPLMRGGQPLTLQGVQGGSVWGGLFYLSTNQIKSNRGDIFTINLTTGEIVSSMDLVCGMGLSEMEGIDIVATGDGREEEGGGALRMLVANNFLDLFCTVTELVLVDPRSQPHQLRPSSAVFADFWRWFVPTADAE